MIEFALLFGLGFLSAALIAMLIAPAIHRRIVRYTENRIKATLPISPQEVRAQRDMARAVYAAENARTKQELVQSRDRATALQLRGDALEEDLKRAQAVHAELKMQIDDLDVETADARNRLREEDSYIQQLRAALQKAEEAEAERALEADGLRQQLLRLTSDADNFRIDLSTRETEVENLRTRATTLRDERESLRNEVRLQTTRARDAETRLAQEEQRAARLDEKLGAEIAARTDKETALERKTQEIVRLREKLKAANAEAREASRAARAGTDVRPSAKAANSRRKAVSDVEDTDDVEGAPLPQPGVRMTDVGKLDPAFLGLLDDARNRATALSERLLNSKSAANDEALRQELASIAANMVAVTAASEGSTSPIRAILAGKTGSGKRESLAARAKKTLASTGGSSTS